MSWPCVGRRGRRPPDPVSQGATGRRRLEAIVRGRVQGVGYRVFVIREAMSRGLVGWVANLPDGAVRTIAEGSPEALESFLGRLREGPPAARVDDVLVAWPPSTGEFSSFSVRSGWHGGD